MLSNYSKLFSVSPGLSHASNALDETRIRFRTRLKRTAEACSVALLTELAQSSQLGRVDPINQLGSSLNWAQSGSDLIWVKLEMDQVWFRFMDPTRNQTRLI